MATYGRGQMLGSGINPESFKQDYSGFANAAAIQAQGISNFGKSIGNAISDFNDIKKENKRVEAMNKAAAKSIEAAITLGNSYGISGANETLSPFLAAANDPNLSSIEKAALLSEAKAMIPNVFGRFDSSQEMALRQAQLSGRKPSNLQLNTIKEIVNGQTYEVPVTFNPSDGTTRRLDGSIVGSSKIASSIDSISNMPNVSTSKGMQGTANDINNALPLHSYQPSEEDLTGSSVPPLYTDDTSQLPPVGNVPIDQQSQAIDTGLSLEQTSLPPGAVPIDKSEGELMTTDQFNNLIKQGYKVSGRPAGGGKIFVTKQESISPKKGQEIIYNPDGTVSIRDIVVGNDLNKAPTTKLKEGEALVADPNSPTGSKVVQIPSEQIERNKKDFSSFVSQMANSYGRLNDMGKAVSGGEANPLAYAESTPTGQAVSRMFGSDAQVLRDQINTMMPAIINVIRQTSQMGAKGMDSEKELQFYLRSMGDPTLPVEANIKALETLDKVYGEGNAIKSILKNYPELSERVKKYEFAPTSEKDQQGSTQSVPSAGLDELYKKHIGQ